MRSLPSSLLPLLVLPHLASAFTAHPLLCSRALPRGPSSRSPVCPLSALRASEGGSINRRFAFVPYGETWEGDGVSICADGLVKGTSLQLTHWTGNQTPKEYKEDLSTEICLRFNAMNAGKKTKYDDATITNNHFDTDGIMSVFALLHPEKAEEHRELLISAAAAGDFQEWGMDDSGVMLDIAVEKLAEEAGSDEEAYRRIIPRVGELLETLEERGDLWGEGMREVEEGMARVDDGTVVVDRLVDEKKKFIHAGADVGDIGVLVHPAGCPPTPGVVLSRVFPWFLQGMGKGVARHLMCYEQEDGTYMYEYERPRYAWVATETRPGLPKPDSSIIIERLEEEWTGQGLSCMTGICRTAKPIKGKPMEVADMLLSLERSLMPSLKPSIRGA